MSSISIYVRAWRRYGENKALILGNLLMALVQLTAPNFLTCQNFIWKSDRPS